MGCTVRHVHTLTVHVCFFFFFCDNVLKTRTFKQMDSFIRSPAHRFYTEEAQPDTALSLSNGKLNATGLCSEPALIYSHPAIFGKVRWPQMLALLFFFCFYKFHLRVVWFFFLKCCVIRKLTLLFFPSLVKEWKSCSTSFEAWCVCRPWNLIPVVKARG